MSIRFRWIIVFCLILVFSLVSFGIGTAQENEKPAITASNVDQIAEVNVIESNTDGVSSVAYHPQGNLIAVGGTNGNIHLLNAETGEIQSTLSGQTAEVYALAFSSDGTRLFAAAFSMEGFASDSNVIHQWDIETATQLDDLKPTVLGARTLSVSPDGQTIAVDTCDGSINFSVNGILCDQTGIGLVDLTTGEIVQNFSSIMRRDQMWRVVFGPDGKQVAGVGLLGSVVLVDLDTGSLQTFPAQPEHFGMALAISPNGNSLAVGSSTSDSGEILIFNVETGEQVNTLSGHTSLVLDLAFNLDGSLLVSAGADNTIRFWDITAGQELNALTGAEDMVISVAFSPDGTTLVSGSADDTVRLWEIAVED